MVFYASLLICWLWSSILFRDGHSFMIDGTLLPESVHYTKWTPLLIKLLFFGVLLASSLKGTLWLTGLTREVGPVITWQRRRKRSGLVTFALSSTDQSANPARPAWPHDLMVSADWSARFRIPLSAAAWKISDFNLKSLSFPNSVNYLRGPSLEICLSLKYCLICT